MTGYTLTVIDSFTIAGRGLVATGLITTDAEPDLGDVAITLPGGRLELGHVSGWDKFAIPRWWCVGTVGALLRGRTEIPVGSVIRGRTKP